MPASVTFNDGDTEKTIAFMATEDEEDDDDESVKLSFGSSLPDRVSEGTRTETTLNIGDDDDPTVTVTFGQTAYTVDEGATQQVTVTVSADPERTIIIPITTTLQGTASTADYSGRAAHESDLQRWDLPDLHLRSHRRHGSTTTARACCSPSGRCQTGLARERRPP